MNSSLLAQDPTVDVIGKLLPVERRTKRGIITSLAQIFLNFLVRHQKMVQLQPGSSCPCMALEFSGTKTEKTKY